jgi:hypothetical protein
LSLRGDKVWQRGETNTGDGKTFGDIHCAHIGLTFFCRIHAQGTKADGAKQEKDKKEDPRKDEDALHINMRFSEPKRIDGSYGIPRSTGLVISIFCLVRRDRTLSPSPLPSPSEQVDLNKMLVYILLFNVCARTHLEPSRQH